VTPVTPVAVIRRLDRIEDAAVVPDDNVADLAELGVTVVHRPLAGPRS
jgi:hypothetical protein